MSIDYAIDLLLIVAVVALSVWAITTQRRLERLTKQSHDTPDRGILTLVDCPSCRRAVIGRKRLDCGDLNRPPWSRPVLTQVTSCTVCGAKISERNLGSGTREVTSDSTFDSTSQTHS